MTNITTGEIAEMVSAFGVMALYFATFLMVLVRHPSKITLGCNLMERQRWVHKIMFKLQKNEILGVQTARNATMASSFFASSSLLVSYGILSKFVDRLPAAQLTFYDIKAIILGIVFFLAFLAFSLAVRNNNHLSFLICLDPLHHQDKAAEVAEVAEVVQEAQSPPMPSVFSPREREKAMRSAYDSAIHTVTQATLFFALGMRFFYIALPIGLWLFGTPGLIVGTVLLVALLIPLDYRF